MSSPEAVEMPCPPSVPGLVPQRPRPPAWDTLARSLGERRPLSARYHGQQRVVCPHALGWSGQRAKVLAYQVAGGTSTGVLPGAPEQRWRSMFVDEIETPVIVEERWHSARNYCDDPTRMGMDVVELRLRAGRGPAGQAPGG